MARISEEFWDPDGTRYGIPTYWWRGAPDGYATRRQLRDTGLRPAGQPVAAQVLWRGVGGTRAAYLFRVDLAQPKRDATDAQLAAVDKALTARRTCPTCDQERPYYIPRSLGECLDCAPTELAPDHQHDREPDAAVVDHTAAGPDPPARCHHPLKAPITHHPNWHRRKR